MNSGDKARLNQVGVPDRGAGGKLSGDSTRGVGDMIEDAIDQNNNAFTPDSGTLTVTGDVTVSGTVTGTTAVTSAAITSTADVTAGDDFESTALAGRLNFTNATSGSTNIAEIRSSAADAAGTIALRIAAGADLATAGAKILSLGDNAATSYSEKLSVNYDGTLAFPAAGSNVLQFTGRTADNIAFIRFDGGTLRFIDGSSNTLFEMVDAGSTGYLTITGSGSTHKLGADTATLGGVLVLDVAAVGNVDAGTDDLITYTLPASTLVTAGRGIRIKAWGTTANTANAKTLTLDFGGQVISTQAMTVNEANVWEMEAVVARTGASTQDIYAKLHQLTGTALVKGTLTAGTQTETGAIIIKCTGAATTTNDIVQEGLLVEAL